MRRRLGQLTGAAAAIALVATLAHAQNMAPDVGPSDPPAEAPAPGGPGLAPDPGVGPSPAPGGSDLGAPPTARPDGPIPLDEFLELFAGKTVYFEMLDGSQFAREYYVPGGKSTVFATWAGDCYEGRWAVDGERYCFHYQGRVSCWLTFWERGRIIVEAENGQRQRVRLIRDNEPLSCKEDLVSRLDAPRRAPRF